MGPESNPSHSGERHVHYHCATSTPSIKPGPLFLEFHSMSLIQIVQSLERQRSVQEKYSLHLFYYYIYYLFLYYFFRKKRWDLVHITLKTSSKLTKLNQEVFEVFVKQEIRDLSAWKRYMLVTNFLMK